MPLVQSRKRQNQVSREKKKEWKNDLTMRGKKKARGDGM